MSPPDKKYTGEDVVIELSPQARAQMEADPELAAAMRDLSAQLRQAQQDFHDGKFASMEEALEAMGAEAIELPDDE